MTGTGKTYTMTSKTKRATELTINDKIYRLKYGSVTLEKLDIRGMSLTEMDRTKPTWLIITFMDDSEIQFSTDNLLKTSYHICAGAANNTHYFTDIRTAVEKLEERIQKMISDKEEELRKLSIELERCKL